MAERITKRAVDKLSAPETGETILWDDEIKGFGVRVQQGGKKVYILQYRAGRGRGAPLRKFTIGPHGSPWTPETARKEAQRLKGLVASGKDPAASKAGELAAPVMADLATRFLAEHAEAKRKSRTTAEYRRLLEKLILPAIGRRKVHELNRADIARLHHSLQRTPYQANRVLAVLGKMMALAEIWGWRDPASGNPVRGLEKFRERQRERMLSEEELARLGEALEAYERGGGSPYVSAALRLLVFTGARLKEILGLQWDWISLERGEARLPDAKSGAKTIHFPPPALAVLTDLPKVAGNPHVIVGRVPGQPLVNLQKPWASIRKAAGLDNLRHHDLRHAFASNAASSGMSLLIIGKMLGQTQPASTARYAHLADDPVKAAAGSVADRIQSAMTGAPPAEVIRLRTVK